MREQAALAHLKTMLGSNAQFRAGQWEAVEAIAVRRGRALVVQCTGWGKSIVYFLATKLLRDQGAGPTLLVSPLLSLMRNQLEMAGRIGLQAFTINSANQSDWDAAENALREDRCDILLISPERLSNDRFLEKVLPLVAARIGLLVVDEAHCISDWGHDFRPDYRRIVRVLQHLPGSVPVLCTTATANDRVIADIRAQIGDDLQTLRGPLVRTSLRLQNIVLPDQAARLAWLAEHLPKMPGSGVVYCLTVADTEKVAGWLRANGIAAEAYHAGDDQNLDRPALEQALLENRFKALVATVALGMGFDKPDLGFVIHFQRPGSVVAYYQQVGRAGRAIDRSYGILLSGAEDDEIQEFFIESAFPPPQVFEDILETLERYEKLGFNQLLAEVNVSHATAEKALKILEIDGAVGVIYEKGRLYYRTPNPWRPDLERIAQVTGRRREELRQMQAYVQSAGCLMQFLCVALDDPGAARCGRCANCVGAGLSADVPAEKLNAALQYLRGVRIAIPPRSNWPAGVFPDLSRRIPLEWRNADGRALADYGDAGWGREVQLGKYVEGAFSAALVRASADLIVLDWRPDPFPAWVTAIPSLNRPALVRDFAAALAVSLAIPFYEVLERVRISPEQKAMENSSMQARNVENSLQVSGDVPNAPVLLVDDIFDSRWTLTVAGWLLRQAGSGTVFPFTLARASKRSS